MNRMLAAASLALLMGTAAYVPASAAMAELKPYTMDATADLRASDLIGQRIYATETDVEGRTLARTELVDFDDIGEVNDVILTQAGEVKAVILGIGGFLGLGEQDVTVDMSSLRFVAETDGTDRFIVVNANKDQLTAIADQQKSQMAAATEAAAVKVEETAAAAGAAVTAAGETVVEETKEAAAATTEAVTETTETAAETVTTTVPVTETAEAAPDPATTEPVNVVTAAPVERELFKRPAVVNEGYTDVASAELTVDEMTGKRVYGINNEDIGEVSDLVLGSDGTTVEHAVLDVGGFLGIGERNIAVPLDELQVQKNADGDVRLYIQATQEQLENQPEYVAE